MKALLVCSAGGHLQEMLALEPAWQDFDPTWVTLRGEDTEHLLAAQAVVWAHGPTNRSLVNLARNLALAVRTLRRVNPDVVLSTGAALAVPFLVLARLTGRRTVYVESYTRRDQLSLSGRMVYRLVDVFFVQWPELAARRARARYAGAIL